MFHLIYCRLGYKERYSIDAVASGKLSYLSSETFFHRRDGIGCVLSAYVLDTDFFHDKALSS